MGVATHHGMLLQLPAQDVYRRALTSWVHEVVLTCRQRKHGSAPTKVAAGRHYSACPAGLMCWSAWCSPSPAGVPASPACAGLVSPKNSKSSHRHRLVRLQLHAQIASAATGAQERATAAACMQVYMWRREGGRRTAGWGTCCETSSLGSALASHRVCLVHRSLQRRHYMGRQRCLRGLLHLDRCQLSVCGCPQRRAWHPTMMQHDAGYHVRSSYCMKWLATQAACKGRQAAQEQHAPAQPITQRSSSAPPPDRGGERGGGWRGQGGGGRALASRRLPATCHVLSGCRRRRSTPSRSRAWHSVEKEQPASWWGAARGRMQVEADDDGEPAAALKQAPASQPGSPLRVQRIPCILADGRQLTTLQCCIR